MEEAEKQKKESFLDELKRATLELFEQDLAQIEERLATEALPRLTDAIVPQRFAAEWKPQLLAEIREEGLVSEVQERLTREISALVDGKFQGALAQVRHASDEAVARALKAA